MTTEEINELFPPTYGGVAQISDLRLALSKLASNHELGGVEFNEVSNIHERDLLNPKDGHLCKVRNSDGTGNSQTYIYWEGFWIALTNTMESSSQIKTQRTERFVINTFQEQEQKITLEYKPDINYHLFVFLNGVYQTMGANFDYILSDKDLIFNGGILTYNDLLIVKYTY